MFHFLTATTNSSGSGGSDPTMLIVMIVLLGAVFYFMMIRPQQKQKKEKKALLDSLEVGDEITTIGGLVGKIVQIKDDTVIFETGYNQEKTKIRIVRGAIASIGKSEDNLGS